ncbi:hypothetical protein [Actinomadura xylanilytica]|uniref:hypothetical protein n=1 Tax=Actinomadura xylanilytica TaxID=887459 RepID=UPI00255B3D85|nr:hypothetical protein [Actinomadura xylanilytica]MDL4774388.1 hypothetical protein [Actinomadura xylanilytica]
MSKNTKKAVGAYGSAAVCLVTALIIFAMGNDTGTAPVFLVLALVLTIIGAFRQTRD